MATKPTKSGETQLRCFVISPIGDKDSPVRLHADMLLHSIIEPALSPKFAVKRSDAFGVPEMISDKIISALFDYELAIADLTGHNPNVFYELGLRHMVEKPVIHIASVGTKLPFDNAGVATIFFNISDYHSHLAARAEIAKAAEQVTATGYKVSNPVTQSRAAVKLAQSSDTKDQLISQMSQRITALEQQMREQTSRMLTTFSDTGSPSVFGSPSILGDASSPFRLRLRDPYQSSLFPSVSVLKIEDVFPTAKKPEEPKE